MSLADDFYLVDLVFDNDFVAAPNGDLQTIAGINNYKQALFHRLITAPGALVHRPQYGVGVLLYQNAIASLSVQQELAQRIREQFERDFRTEKVTSIAFTQEPEGKFTIKYKVKAAGVGEIQGEFNPFGDFEI